MHVSIIAERDETRIVASVEDHPLTAWINAAVGRERSGDPFPAPRVGAAIACAASGKGGGDE